jgi:hypothetical protein
MEKFDVLTALKMCAATFGQPSEGLQTIGDDDFIEHRVRLYGRFLKYIDRVIKENEQDKF